MHCRWVERLEEEFFLQGDRERALGLPLSPLFDRTKPGASKSQASGALYCFERLLGLGTCCDVLRTC